MTTTRLIITTFAAALPLAIGGCASEPTPTERDFGNSVRQMIRAQTYDPSTLTSPSEEPVESTDGQMLEGSLESYRRDTGNRESVDSDIVVGVDGGQR